jgi:hypothetical protein
MEDLKGLASFVSELKARRTSLVDELGNIEATLSHLASLDGRSNHTGPTSTGRPDTKTKRIVSAASRRKMALAQKARWANIRKKSRPMAAGKTTSQAPAKRKISAAGRKRIAAATRARWAAFRAAKKKAA